MRQISSILLTLFLFFASPSWAELRKWIDAQGNVHYGHTAPRGAKVQEIDSSTMSSMDSQSANRGFHELNQTFKAQRELAQRDKLRVQKQQQKRQQQQDRCENLRKNLKIIRLKAPIYTRNPDGTRNYISDEQRKKNITEAQSTLNKYCS